MTDHSAPQTNANGSLSSGAIAARLTTRLVGRSLVYLPECGSTNDEARWLAESGASDGTLVLTDYQSAGRGRLDRKWQAPPGTSLLMSLIFRPALPPHLVQRLTMLFGLAVAEAIEAETGLEAGLKWPNDVLVAGKKVAGMLTEVEMDGMRVKYAVVGIGLNVNLDPAALGGPLLARATSLSAELGRPVARVPLLATILARIEARYLAIDVSSGDVLRREWAARLTTLGHPVVVSTGDEQWTGVAQDIDDDGALLVLRPDGHVVRVIAGDVTTNS